MSDPDLRSDETILLRTPEVYVKSISFEGIITNKRIVLVDQVKNLQPPKEIPLATIKDIEGGENAIRDPVVTITVITRTGETRQMVLTFSRTAGGNRNKERDEWVKTLKENVSSSYEQVIRKGIPDLDQSGKRSKPASYPRIEVTSTPSQPANVRPLPKKELDTVHPIKKIIENAPSKTIASAKELDTYEFGTFCSRCGNKVPEGSGFCNRCGSSIIPPGSTSPVSPAVPDYRAQAQRPVDRQIQKVEPLIEHSQVRVPLDPQVSEIPEPAVEKTIQPADFTPNDKTSQTVKSPQPAAPAETSPRQKPVKKPLIPRLFSPKELAQTPLNPESMPTGASPSPKKPRRASRMPGKKVLMAIGAILLLIVIVVAGVVFVYPMISGIGSSQSNSSTQSLVTVTTTTKIISTPAPSGTIVISETTAAPTVPNTGVYAHINYIGGWKGTYGMPTALQTVTNSGERFFEIENATGPVQVTAEKLDGSTRHELVVEIYKNGGLLATAKTSDGFGKVTVSADATTGVAKATPAVTVSATTTIKPVTNVTTVKTTVPATTTTTSKP